MTAVSREQPLRKVRIELTDNQSDSLAICPAVTGKGFKIEYTVEKQVSGVVNTGTLVLSNNGDLIGESYEFETDDIVCLIDYSGSLVGGEVTLNFQLNSVGENVTFEGLVSKI